MASRVTENTDEWLILRVNLSEIALVSRWIERLAWQHAIPERVQFASNLCIEELLSNVVLHGYGGKANEDAVMVRFETPRNESFVFVVEDRAPHFNPLDQPELPALNPNEEMWIGGQGLRLLRRFADAIEYERLPVGNKLKLFFSANRFDEPVDQK